MTQLTINIEDSSILPHLKRILNAIEGVSVVKTEQRRSGLDEAMDEVREGHVNHYENVSEMFKALGI